MIIRAVVQAREKKPPPFNFQTFPRDFFVDRSTVSFVINDLGRGKVNLLLCFQNFIKYTSYQFFFFFFFIYWFWFLLLSLQINLSIQTLIGALIFFSSCFFENTLLQKLESPGELHCKFRRNVGTFCTSVSLASHQCKIASDFSLAWFLDWKQIALVVTQSQGKLQILVNVRV